jgi:hypothetical protein
MEIRCKLWLAGRVIVVGLWGRAKARETEKLDTRNRLDWRIRRYMHEVWVENFELENRPSGTPARSSSFRFPSSSYHHVPVLN